MDTKVLRNACASAGTRRRTAAAWSRRVVAGMVCGAAASTSLVIGATTSGAVVAGVNGRIAFESNRTGNNDIFTMSSDGTAPIDVTPDSKASDVFPAWNPDSTKISFSSDRAEAGNADIYVMNADGTGVTRLTNSPGEDRSTSWTSDSQKIVFHSARFGDMSHSFDIFTMDANGTNQTKIFSNGSAPYVCGNKTNGRIVFNSSSDPLGTNPSRDFEIFTMDMTGGNVVQVTDNTVTDSGPKWSPDCTKISYNSIETTSFDVHRINANGTGDVNLTNMPGVFDAFSAWSPDSTRIVFTSERADTYEIFTMSAADGSDVQRLTNTNPGTTNFRSDWGSAPTPRQTSLTCRTTTPGIDAVNLCTVSDTDGLRSIQVRNTTTSRLQVTQAYDCSNAPTSATFRVPAGTKYKVAIIDCSRPKNETDFTILANNRVVQAG